MALMGSAALVMWWDIEPAHAAAFQHWHAHEHFPERLGIPGFRRATRWRDADGGPGVLVTYELADHSVLSSPAYVARLNAPSPWSARMMPLHRNMVRSQCEVLDSHGAYTAGSLLAIRLSPATTAQARGLLAALREAMAPWTLRPGLAGAHLLRHRPPPIAQTTEQKIRGNDRYADWVLLVAGYDRDALQSLSADELSDAALAAMGADAVTRGLYALALSAVPSDLHDVTPARDPQAGAGPGPGAG